MRCPQCGTENEPDSRFCGGCGARIAGALPPTQKIDTGAQPIQSPPSVQPSAQYVRAPTSQPPVSQPPRSVSGQQGVPPASYPMAPSVNRPPSVDRPAPQGSNGAVAAPAQSMEPTSQRRRPSLSEPPPLPPKRNIALIVIVLIVDLALAGAGAYMLAEGLREPDAPAENKAAPAAGSATKASIAPAAGSATVVSPIVVDAAVAVTPDVAPPDAADIALAAGSGSAAPPEKKTVKSRKKKPRPNNKTPVDPYDDGPPLGIPPANPDDPDS